jgi:cobalt-zinc-cadmium efflux system outer membrane protein
MTSRIWLTALLASSLVTPALAGPLTYAQALDQADRSAPGLQADELRVAAAQAASRAAGRLPDPKVSFGVEDFPVSGPNAGSFTRDDFTMTTIGVRQDVPNAGRRRADVAGATAEIGAAQAQTAETRRNIRIATALAWIDLAYAEKRLQALDRLTGGLKDLWSALSASVAAGASRPALGTEPQRLEVVFADKRSELVAALAKAKAELTRWTGEADPSPVGEAPHYDIDAGALRKQLTRLPDFARLDAAERKAAAEVDAALAAKRPDWGVEVSYGHRDPMFGDMVSAGVTMSVPIFTDRRQQPVIEARKLDRNRIALEREDRRRALVAALDGDVADHVMHHEQWRRAVDVLVPTAQKRADLEVASYGAGRASFDDVRMALTDLADAELDALDREAMVARDGARIIFTYGAEP